MQFMRSSSTYHDKMENVDGVLTSEKIKFKKNM